MDCFVCETCAKQFATKFSMLRHCQIIHERVKDYTCQCSKKFATKHQLKRHWMLKHTKTLPHKCTDECGKSVQSKKDLVHHQVKHAEWYQNRQLHYQNYKQMLCYQTMTKIVRENSRISEDGLKGLDKEIEEIVKLRKKLTKRPKECQDWLSFNN